MNTARAKQLAGLGLTARVRCLMHGYGLPRWGNLRRTAPFSSSFGFARGTPFDRHYLHRFLDAQRRQITGAVLERSRFVVLAAVTAAELAHRITYAWPR